MRIRKNLSFLKVEKIALLNQKHTEKIITLKEMPLNKINFIGNGDGILTNLSGIYLGVLTADCLPIIFFDRKERVIGIIHAGWRGTVKGIAKKLVKKMKEEFSSLPENILAGIGPGIGKCCYEVGKEWIKKYGEGAGNFIEERENKFFLDLKVWNIHQLIEEGIDKRNIEVLPYCTSCNSNIFFSERKNHPTGRFLSAISLV